MSLNPLGLTGISFVEFSSSDPGPLERLFKEFGFSKLARHRSKRVDLFTQGGIQFLLNSDPNSFGARFSALHGPSISAMGWKFEDAEAAYREACARGARPLELGDYTLKIGRRVPAIYGIGDSVIYFIDSKATLDFELLATPDIVPEKGFLLIDHLTNNVYRGTMNRWAEFYQSVFGFTEVRHFDIKGKKTGLMSYALRSPCGTFCIPINEADEAKSQINEYLDEYRGPGIQHLAFLTRDLIDSVQRLKGTGIQTLDIDPNYYAQAFARVPNVKEDKKAIRDLNILVDGDDEGYLLQIFTKNVVGPIFIELIQRENHHSFGEGNFQALFDSIERDQMRRGVL